MIVIQTSIDSDEVFLFATRDGLEKLVQRLEELLAEKETDHIHLMSNEWSGMGELNIIKWRPEFHNVHHLKVHLSSADWLSAEIGVSST